MVYILIFFLLTWENFYIFWANVVANISSAALWRKAIFNFTDRCRLMLYNLFFDQGIWLIICRDLIMGWAACSRIVKFLLDPMIFFWLCTCWTYTSWKTTPFVCTSNTYFTLLVVLHFACCTVLPRHIRGFIICLFKGIFWTEEMSPSPCIPVYIKK